MHSEESRDQGTATDGAMSAIFLDAESHAPIEGEGGPEDPADLSVGDIVTLRGAEGKRDYRITAVTMRPEGPEDSASAGGTGETRASLFEGIAENIPEDAPVVLLTPARSQLKKTALLLGILAVFWFAIKYAIVVAQSLLAN